MSKDYSSPRLTAHHPINPFMGKTFKKVTYNNKGEEIASEAINIESQIELKTTLEEVKQYNDDNSETGNTQKLITL